MVRKCCFCKATTSKNIMLHSFPPVDEGRQAWIDAIPIKMRAYRSSCLCSRHFHSDDYKLGKSGKPFLCSNAVPSIFVLSDLPDLNGMKTNTTRDPLNLNSADSDTSNADSDSDSVDTESTKPAISESFELPRKRPEKFSLKGKPLDEKSMVMLMNVLDYFHRTSDVGETILVERTAFACGVSAATVYRTRARFKAAEQTGTPLSVPRKRTFVPQKKSVPRNKRVRRKKSKSSKVKDFPKQSEGDDTEDCIGEYCIVKEEITEYNVTDFSTESCFLDENFVKVDPSTVSVIKQEDNLY